MNWPTGDGPHNISNSPWDIRRQSIQLGREMSWDDDSCPHLWRGWGLGELLQNVSRDTCCLGQIDVDESIQLDVSTSMEWPSVVVGVSSSNSEVRCAVV